MQMEHKKLKNFLAAKDFVVELAPPYIQSILGFREEMVQTGAESGGSRGGTCPL